MTEPSSRGSAPYQVLLMFAIVIATIALGFYMMPSSQEEKDKLLSELGTTNHGVLLKPTRDISALPLTDEYGAPWSFDDQPVKWRLLILPATGTCDKNCEDLLYLTRQVHVRLAKHAHRVERVFVATEGLPGAELASDIGVNHPHTPILHTTLADLRSWLDATGSRIGEGVAEAVLVDPAGRAMMVYDTRHEGNGMLEDINHLLKYSAK